MASDSNVESEEILNILQNEYEKFLDISKNFSNGINEQLMNVTTTTTTTTQLVKSRNEHEEFNGESSICSHRNEDCPKSKFSLFKRSFTETVAKFGVLDQFQIISTTISESLQNIPDVKMFVSLHGMWNDPIAAWRKSEALKRPDGLLLNLIGVALFKGNEIFSKAIRKFTKSRYSHVALLMHDISKENSDPNGWYIYSANGSASQIFAEHRLPQVQLEKWSDIVETYDGAAGVRMILFHDDASPDANAITELVDRYLGLPYETQLLVMLKALHRANVEAEDHAKSAFCSEICYRFLISCGVIEDTEIPENVWPKDFSDENEKLPLKKGKWGDVVVHKGSFVKVSKKENLDNKSKDVHKENH